MLRRVLISVLILVPILALSGVLYGVEVRHDRIIREEGNAMRTLEATYDAARVLDGQRERVAASVYSPLRPGPIQARSAEFGRLLRDPRLALGPESRELVQRILVEEQAFAQAALELPRFPSPAQVAEVREQGANVADLLAAFRAEHSVNLSALVATEQEQRYLSITLLLVANGVALALVVVGLVLLGRLGRSEAETQAARAAEQLRAEFVAFAAHELRNPTSAIQMGASMLQEPDPEAATRAQVLDGISRNADALSRVVLNLLNLGRIEAGELRLQRHAVSLPALVDELLSESQAYNPELYRRVESEVPEVRVNVDPEFVKLVISNLLDNAVKYSPAESRIYLTGERRDDMVEVRVRDEGAGIPRELMPHIFDRWETGGRAPYSARRGSGLGLYMARLLVEAHGGAIGADSAPGQGTTISFTLPIPAGE